MANNIITCEKMIYVMYENSLKINYCVNSIESVRFIPEVFRAASPFNFIMAMLLFATCVSINSNLDLSIH